MAINQYAEIILVESSCQSHTKKTTAGIFIATQLQFDPLHMPQQIFLVNKL